MTATYETAKQWVVTAASKDIGKSVSFKVWAETEKLAAIYGLMLAVRKSPMYELVSVREA